MVGQPSDKRISGTATGTPTMRAMPKSESEAVAMGEETTVTVMHSPDEKKLNCESHKTQTSAIQCEQKIEEVKIESK
jgi:hypothetical protein